VVLAQKIQRVFRVFLVHPTGLTKLHGNRVIWQAFARCRDALQVVLAIEKPLGKLEEHGAQFARVMHRHQRASIHLPDLVNKLRREVLVVHIFLLAKCLWQFLTKAFGQCA